jgi:predicted ATPase/DNA-binding SARP family transcriptional activator
LISDLKVHSRGHAGLAPFVGRRHELDLLTRTLSESRLVTLSGLGGMGKTRLAAEAADRVADLAPDGVWWVDLSGVSDPDLVLPTAASALGLIEEAGRPLRETLVAAVRHSRTLIVLDNCEHLLSAAASLPPGASPAGPGVRVLATSREPMGLPGEVVVPVPPLDLPTSSSPEELAEADAVRLFAERAGVARPGFRVDEVNAAQIADICRRLDGIPLAIELAAARVKVLGLRELAERLQDRFDLLGTNPLGVPRQQTLRGVLDWSYDLLAEPERRLFDRLGAFYGGFSLDAAEHVCAFPPLTGSDLIELLARLVDKSLVAVTEIRGRARYSRIETVRLYARERLGSSVEEAEVRSRHADWCLDLARTSVRADGEAAALNRLEIEHDNFRSALAWAVQRDPGRAVALVSVLAPFWDRRGHLSEGRRWAEEALTAGADMPPGRNVVLTWLGRLARYDARYADAEEHLHRAADASRENQDPSGTAAALTELGRVAGLQGQRSTARFLYREALGLFREAADDAGSAEVTLLLGQLAAQEGDWDEARRCDEESLTSYRRRHDLRGTADALVALGTLARLRDDFENARRLLEEALAIQEELLDERGMASSLASLAFVSYLNAEHAESERLFHAAARIRRSRGDRRGLALALVGVANAMLLRSDPPADLAGARVAAEEGLAIQREIGDRANLAWTTYCLSEISRDLGNTDAARAYAEESLLAWRDLGDDRHSGLAYYSLAELARAEGDLRRAAALAAEALSRAQQVGAGLQIVRCLELAAAVSAHSDDMATAALVFGAAEAGRERLRLPPRHRETDQWDRIRALTFDAAGGGDPDLAGAWHTGRAMTLAEAVGAARAAVTGGAPAPTIEVARSGPAAPADGGRDARGAVQVLGRFSVTWDGVTATPAAGAVSQALKALALRSPLHVEELAELLWEDAPPGAGRRRLHNVLSRIRKSYDGLVVRDGEMVCLAPGVETDAGRFESATTTALAAAEAGAAGAEQLMEDAIGLYAGELLPADRFEPWTTRRREAMFQLSLRLMDALCGAAAGRGDVSAAVSWLERAIEADPLDELNYVRAARLLRERGWASRARATLRRAREVAAELEVEPSADVLLLEEQLRN